MSTQSESQKSEKQSEPITDPLAVLNSLPGKQVEQLATNLDVCPECGSGDVRICSISHRPYCNECSHWAPVNFGTLADSVRQWNARSIRTQATPIRHVPRVVVGSPAYQMPEIKSEAEIWAADYVKKYAESQWVMDLLVRSYDAGHSAGQTTKVGYVVGYTSLSHRLPDFTRAAFDGLKDAEQFAQEQNDRFKMLKHKVYELHEVEVSK